MIDQPQQSLILQNRLLFLRNVQQAIDHLQAKDQRPEVHRLRCAKFMDFKMPDPTENGGLSLEKLVADVK